MASLFSFAGRGSKKHDSLDDFLKPENWKYKYGESGFLGNERFKYEGPSNFSKDDTQRLALAMLAFNAARLEADTPEAIAARAKTIDVEQMYYPSQLDDAAFVDRVKNIASFEPEQKKNIQLILMRERKSDVPEVAYQSDSQVREGKEYAINVRNHKAHGPNDIVQCQHEDETRDYLKSFLEVVEHYRTHEISSSQLVALERTQKHESAAISNFHLPI